MGMFVILAYLFISAFVIKFRKYIGKPKAYLGKFERYIGKGR